MLQDPLQLAAPEPGVARQRGNPTRVARSQRVSYVVLRLRKGGATPLSGTGFSHFATIRAHRSVRSVAAERHFR